MSQENVELVYRSIDAFNRGDIDAFLALHDPDVEVIPRVAEVEGGGPYHGHDGVRSWWEDLFGVSPDFRSEIEEVRDLGNVSIARLYMRGHGIESDALMEQTAWQVIEWPHKKAVSWRIVLSEAEALEAIGARE
jgi:ketosteroid isomerase-like protein